MGERVVDDWRYSLSYSLVFLFKTMLPLGSILPFLATEQGIPETSFASVFVWKAAGSILGALLFALLKEANLIPSSHHLYTVGALGQTTFMLIFIFG